SPGPASAAPQPRGRSVPKARQVTEREAMLPLVRAGRASPFPGPPALAPESCSVLEPRRQQTGDHPAGSEQPPAFARRRGGVPEALARRWLHAGVLLLPTAVLRTSSLRPALLHLPGPPPLLPTPPGKRPAAPSHPS